PIAMTLVKGTISLVFLGLAALWASFAGLDTRSVIWLVASGVIGIALGDSFFFKALQDLGPHLLVVLVLLGQVLTVLFAILFLGERLNWHSAMGIVLV